MHIQSQKIVHKHLTTYKMMNIMT